MSFENLFLFRARRSWKTNAKTKPNEKMKKVADFTCVPPLNARTEARSIDQRGTMQTSAKLVLSIKTNAVAYLLVADINQYCR